MCSGDVSAEGTPSDPDRLHWREQYYYVGELCSCCVRYVHKGLGKEHREWCLRHPDNINSAFKGDCIESPDAE